jgi:two-component sensor histidine kinase
LGWTLDELMAKPWVDFVHPDDVQSTIAEGQALSNGQTTIAFENRYLCKDGRYRVLQWRAVPSPVHGVIFAAARDVTQIREAQEALHASLAENKASLLEKEVLLKEIHHRVKNNLQVVSSLLKLHGDQIVDPVARGAFQDSQDRVRAIALLHEKLYQSKNLGSVSMAEYCESLLQTLMRTHGTVAGPRISIDAPGVSLPVDVAVPCGLILNELVTNSLKHAFPARGEQAPEIRIAMIADDTHLTLSISDNGVGLSTDFELVKSRTLGIHLVRTLARQLRAELTTSGKSGTHWTFRFPRKP